MADTGFTEVPNATPPHLQAADYPSNSGVSNIQPAGPADLSGTDPAYQPLPQDQVDLGPEQPSGPTTVIHGAPRFVTEGRGANRVRVDTSTTITQPQVPLPHLQAADYPSESGIYNKEEQARAVGHSWQDIDAYQGPRQVAALDAGYDQNEVDQYLGYTSPADMLNRHDTSWMQVFHTDPSTLQKLQDPEVELNLTSNPSWKQQYSNALLNGEVKGPEDFADQYAASAMEAQKQLVTMGDTPIPQASARGAIVRGAQELIAQLPSRRDLIDAALSIPGQIGDVKRNLMDNWQETGQDPLDAAIKAQNNQELMDKFQTAITPAFTDPQRDAIEPALEVPLEELFDTSEYKKSPAEIMLDAGIDVGTVAGLNVLGKLMPSILKGASKFVNNEALPVGQAVQQKLDQTLPSWLSDWMNKAQVQVVKPEAEAGLQVRTSNWMEQAQPVKEIEREPAPAPAEGEAPKPAEEQGPQPFPTDAQPVEVVNALAKERLEGQADKLETMRLTREGLIPDEFSDPNLFRNLAANENPEVQELASGYDLARNYKNWSWANFKDIFTDLMGNEQGTYLQPETRAANIAGKNYGDELIRTAQARSTQSTEALSAQFEQFRKLEEGPERKAFENALNGPHPVSAFDTPYGMLWRALDEGDVVIDANSKYAPLLNTARAANEFLKDNVIQPRVDEGLMPSIAYREYYLKHLYDNPDVLTGRSYSGGGGKQGSLGFARQRIYESYREAVAEGAKLKYTSVIDNVLATHEAAVKAANWLDMQKTAMDSNWAYWSTSGAKTQGDQRLVGMNTQKFARDEEGTTQLDANGTPLQLQMYGRPGFANLYNNAVGYDNYNLSTSKLKTWGDRALALKNFVTQSKLVAPIFHTITVVKAAQANMAADIMDQLASGQIGRATWNLAKYATQIGPAIEYTFKGAGYRAAYRRMVDDPALKALVDAGFTFKDFSREHIIGHIPTLDTSLWRGSLGRELRTDLNGNLLELPFKEMSRVATTIGAPLFQQMIPMMKAGAGMQRMLTFMRSMPAASEGQIALRARQIVDNLDDRFGEVNMNNVFWPNALKQVMNQTLLSSSWVYGTMHATAASLGWRMGRGAEWNPVAFTNLLGQLATLAGTNALWSYAIDGKLPDQYYDYLVPFATARAAARGIGRMLVPGEEKEYYDWMNIAARVVSTTKDMGFNAGIGEGIHATAEYGEAKLQPALTAISNLLSSEDAIGNKMFRGQQGWGTFFKDIFAPAFLQNEARATKWGLTPTENLMGMRPTPAWMQSWDTWRRQQMQLNRREDREQISRDRRALRTE